MEKQLEILKKRLLEEDQFTEEKWKSFLAEGLYIPFVKAMDDYLDKYIESQKPNIQNITVYSAEEKLRDKLNSSREVK